MLMPAIRAITSSSTLALLVSRIGTDHAHDTLALDHLALAAHLLDRCHDFHSSSPTARQRGSTPFPLPFKGRGKGWGWGLQPVHPPSKGPRHFALNTIRARDR